MAIIYGPAQESLPRCIPNQISANLHRSRMRSFGKSGIWALSPRSSIAPFEVMLENTVFAKARKNDIRLDPFPHLVIEEALDRDYYNSLLRTRPPYPGDPTPSNLRLPISGWMLMSLDHYDSVWRDFTRAHTDPEITYRLAEFFADHWPQHLPQLVPGATRFGVLGRDDFDQVDILTDARLEIISPVHGPPGSHRRGHVDTPNRIFSALYYLRAAEDDSTASGLELFRYKGAPPDTLDAFELPPEAIECIKTIPYQANTLVVFPNSRYAIHGSEVRKDTPHERAYVFITAEVEQNLF